MSVAPLGVSRYSAVPIEALDREGAELAAITHGHSLGYMPAAVLTHILHRIVYPERGRRCCRSYVRRATRCACSLPATSIWTS